MSSGEGESGAMEKKFASNRQSSVPPKGNGTDSKRTDNGNSNKQNRHNRRRDSRPSRSGNEASNRRQPPPKPKTYDKRPRGRGNPSDWQRQEVTRDDGAELGSAMRPGSKKGSLNHLLNFTFTPREGEGRGSWGGGKPVKWKGHNRWMGRSPVFNKEQFMQANCQFVVKEDADYSRYTADPDALVDWELIEQVRIYSNDVPSCPICLYPPTAAKITKCGHIYCWACILHYLSLGEKHWSKCPICYESVHQKHLKSVIALETHTYSVGEEITMKLMKRERGTTHAMPWRQWRQHGGKPLNIDDCGDTCYAKLLLASTQQVQAIVEGEMAALQQQLREEGEQSLEGSYVSSAIEMLNVRRASLGLVQEAKEEVAALLDHLTLKDSSSEEESPAESTPIPIKKGFDYNDAFDDQPAESTSLTSPSAAEELASPTSVLSDDLTSPATPEAMMPGGAVEPQEACEAGDGAAQPESSGAEGDVDGASAVTVEEEAGLLELPVAEASGASNPGEKATNCHYYYQAADGQHIYLQSTNARCLVKEYGSWEACPDTITAKIVEIEGITMHAELRRRLRYLGHLPLSCEFRVAELALRPPIVSSQTLQCFQDEIDKQRRARQKKSREERRFDRKMEEKINGKQKGLRVSLGSNVHFPQYSEQTPVVHVPGPPSITSSTASSPLSTPHGSPPASALNPQAAEFTPSGMAAIVAASPPAAVVQEKESSGGAMSFAQMLRAGKAQPSAAPVWPRTASLGASAASRLSTYDSEEDCEDRVPVPDFKASIGDAIQQALEAYSPAPASQEEKPAEKGGKKNRKKKKKEVHLLFANTMACSK